jgi:hypothetical protein
LDDWQSDEEGLSRQLRETGRKLRQLPLASRTPLVSWSPSEAGATADLRLDSPITAVTTYGSAGSSGRVAPGRRAWLVSLLLIAGMGLLVAGGATLMVSLWLARSVVETQQAAFWRWGITTTLLGEGALIVGLTWMASRLWRNSRRLNQQLEGVGSQLRQLHS